jgi:hypothetical protein
MTDSNEISELFREAERLQKEAKTMREKSNSCAAKMSSSGNDVITSSAFFISETHYHL